MKLIIGFITTGLLFICFGLIAQDTIYIANGANFYMSPNTTITVWGDITNAGTINTQSGSKILFYGINWVNTGSVANTGIGSYNFTQPRPAPYTNNMVQTIDGKGSTGSFPTLNIYNAHGINLKNTDTRVADSLNFHSDGGYVVSNGNSLIIGSSAVITGYTDQRYFVTNQTTGFLSKENLIDSFSFPVGIAANDYTPAKLTNTGAAVQMNITVRPFSDSTAWSYHATAPQEGVNRVWKITQTGTGTPNIKVDLQHNDNTNGQSYNNSSAFVTRYIGTKPNGNGGAYSESDWDYVGMSNFQSGTSMGSITTGAPVNNASELSRAGFTDFTYTLFSKAVGDKSPLPVQLMTFNAQKQNTTILLTWVTATEVNSAYFNVERSTDGVTFSSIAKVKAAGHSNRQLKYTLTDEAPAGDINYYRLKMTDKDSTYKYSSIKSVVFNIANDWQVYPNPATGAQLTIHVKVSQLVAGTISLYSINGQRVLNKAVEYSPGNNKLMVDINNLPSGVYWLKVMLDNNIYTNIVNIVH